MLGSRSPSRRLALDLLGRDYEIAPADIDANGVLRFAIRVEGRPNFRTAPPVVDLIRLLRERGVRVRG